MSLFYTISVLKLLNFITVDRLMTSKQSSVVNEKWIKADLVHEQLFDTETSYTESPGGKLSIKQILNGERNAIWETSNPGKSFVKKSIVISNWFYAQDLLLQDNAALEVYQMLLNEGFTIYVWSDNQLIPATDLKDLRKALKTVTAIKQDLFQSEMKKWDLSQDALYLADVRGTHRLIKAFKNIDYLERLSWVNLKKLPTELLDDLAKQLPELRSIQFILNEDDLTDRGLPNSWYEIITAFQFDWFSKKKLTEKTLQPLIQKCLNLKAINLSNIKIPAKLITLPASLEALDYSLNNLTWDDVQGFFNDCPNLKSIKLSNCTNLGKLPNDFRLPVSLESIECPGIDPLTWSDVQSILSDCPNLISLDISRCSNLGKLPNEFRLPASLESLNWGENLTSWSEVQEILSACLSLKSLIFSQCQITDELPNDFSLPASLESLTWIKSTLLWNEIQACVNNCQNLKSMNLGWCKDLGKLQNDFSLPASLEEFSCIKIDDLTWHDVQALIKDCPNLKSLKLASCKNLGKIPKGFSLPASLEKFSCEQAGLTWHDVQALIKDCTNLKSLSLNYCKELDKLPNDFRLPPSLVSLYCNGTNPTWLDVQSIIKACPNLESLDVHYCSNLKELPEDFKIPEGLSLRKDFNVNDSSKSFSYKPSQRPDNLELDKQTADTKTALNVRTFFKPKKNGITPAPRNYRNCVYTEIDSQSKKLGKSTKDFEAFEKISFASASTVEQYYDEHLNDSENFFLGRYPLGQGDWEALPSLSANDVIDPSQIQLDPPAEFSLVFCKEESMYYIKPKNPISTDTVATFIVKTGQSQVSIPPFSLSNQQHQALKALQFNNDGKLLLKDETLNQLSKEELCQALIAYCKLFKAKKLPDNNLENIDFLNQIIRKKAGHCRHRAHVFMALASELNIKCRYNDNDCHAFVEVLKDDEWLRVDLGGTPTKLNVKPFAVQGPSTRLPTAVINKDAEPKPPASNNPFRTWDTQPSTSKWLAEYAKELLKKGLTLPEGKRNLLCTLATEQIDNLHQALLETTKQSHNKVFYIDNLNQVPAHQVIVDNEKGNYSKKDSALMAFLKSAKEGDVLMVNWSEYETEHVGFNTIIDNDERKLKDQLLDKGVTVISLLSHDKKAQMGEDFYSRCREVSSMPPQLGKDRISLPQYPNNLITKPKEIRFYDEDWRSTLTGTLQLTAEGYELTESSFAKALRSKRNPLVLRNAPWHLPSFRAFMRTTIANDEISINGEPCLLNGVSIYRDDRPYDLSDAPLVTLESLPANEDSFVLNHSTYHSFFQCYCAENSKLKALPGFLEQYRNKTINVLLTSTLSNGQWAKLFAKAKKQGVVINLALAPQVNTPFATKTGRATLSQSIRLTNDIDYAIKDNSNDFIIPINEKTSLADLVETLTSTGGHFHSQPSVLSEALLNYKNVILAGNPSKSLSAGLASLFLPKPYLFLNGRCESFKGKLSLVCQEVDGLDFITSSTETITPKMRWEALSKLHNPEVVKHLKKVCALFIKLSDHPPFSYAQLDSMLKRMAWKPTANPFKPLLRLSPDYERLKPLVEEAWLTLKEKGRKKTRLEKVLTEFHYSPYAFVTGSSGAGKSHFVHHELANYYEILEGLDKLENFVRPGSKKKCLFIDEANLLHPDTLAIFNGLCLNPPQLLIKGQLIPVPEGYKVFFAGNFGHMKGRREIPFFAQHGHIITFKALPEQTLRDQVIKPILNTLFGTDCKPIEDIFLKAYKKYSDKLNLTARNLEMMALRAKSFSKTTNDLTTIACLCVQDELSVLLNKQERAQFRDWIETTFKLEKGVLKETKNQANQMIRLDKPSFHLTKSRRSPIRLLDSLMSARVNKIEHLELSQKGINALLIEGEPGIGKSLMAMAYLESKGFHNGKTHEDVEQKYYHLTPAAGLDVIKETLHKAFHEGAVVIIDELNTLPLEGLLNPMLSGVDDNGQAAIKAGFTLIATQNPITYAKRQLLSEAFLNRCQKINLKNYPIQELIEIMTKLTKSSNYAEKTVNLFAEAFKFSISKNLYPKPTPRHLFTHKDSPVNSDELNSKSEFTQKTFAEVYKNPNEKQENSETKMRVIINNNPELSQLLDSQNTLDSTLLKQESDEKETADTSLLCL
jgi:hypothetical protein